MASECGYCGSQDVVWDFKNGFIVCSSCGSVLERIYSSPSVRAEITRLSARERHVSASELGDRLRRVKTFRSVRNKIKKPDLALDDAAFAEYLAGKRGHVKLYVKKSSAERLRKLTELPEVKEALRIIEEYPLLASRTDRVKVASALIYLIAKKGGRLSSALRLVSRLTGASEVHLKRVVKVFRRYGILPAPNTVEGGSAAELLRSILTHVGLGATAAEANPKERSLNIRSTLSEVLG